MFIKHIALQFDGKFGGQPPPVKNIAGWSG